MLSIVEQADFFGKILGEQKIDKTFKYRQIKFLLFQNIDDGVLVYNTFTKQLLLLNNEEYACLNNHSFQYNSATELLIRNWFLVPKNFDEIKCFNQVKFFYNKLDIEKFISNYTVLPTTDCNARCFYCCEHGQKRINMSDETALNVAKFIVNNHGGKNVAIKWFGGEPLYNISPINIISNYLKKSNIKYKANMISNAYLFDSDYINLAKNTWNLSSVQVTLDGTREIYNKTKAYIYKQVDPFDRVIENIDNLSRQNINVIIRLNMDIFNQEDLYSLVDFLADKFSNNNYVSVYAKLLFDDTSDLQRNRTNNERKEIYKAYMQFDNYIYQKGIYHFQRLNNLLTYGHCSSENDHAVTILPTGDLGLCELRTDSDICGNIYDGFTNDVLIKAFKEHQDPVEFCPSCPIYPNCSRLKKCPYYIRACEEYERELIIKRIKRYMVYTYEKYKKL